jgi:hypothetical protein
MTSMPSSPELEQEMMPDSSLVNTLPLILIPSVMTPDDVIFP